MPILGLPAESVNILIAAPIVTVDFMLFFIACLRYLLTLVIE